MKNTLILILLLAVSLSYAVSEIFVLNTISETISRVDLNTGSVNNSFAVTGMYSNKIAVTEEYIYVINSGDDNLQKIDKSTGATLINIQLEEFCSPYDVVIYEGFAFVSGLMSNKVYKIDLSTDTVVGDLEVGIAPQGLLVVDSKLYVANSGYQYPDLLDGTVSVISLDDFSIITTIDVHKNPQKMTLDSNDNIHLVCIGDYDEITGKIVLINTNSDSVDGMVDISGFPFNIAYAPNNRVYVGNAFGGGLFVYDADSLEMIHNGTFSFGGSAIAVSDETIFVADAGTFNDNSTIYLYDMSEESITSYNTAIGSVDIAFATTHTSVETVVVQPQLQFNAYPNPFTKNLNVSVTSNNRNSEYLVSVYNTKGQFINKLSNQYWDGTDVFGGNLPNGIYLVRVQSGNDSVTKKVTLIR